MRSTGFVALTGDPGGGTQQVDGNRIHETEREFRTRKINIGIMGVQAMVEGMAVKAINITSGLRADLGLSEVPSQRENSIGETM